MVKGGTGRGEGCKPERTPSPHPTPTASVPSFHFVGRAGGGGCRTQNRPPFSGFRGSHCPKRNVRPAAPEGRGLFPCPRQACFVLATQGPSWPSPARPSVLQFFQARSLRDKTARKSMGLGRRTGTWKARQGGWLWRCENTAQRPGLVDPQS